MNEKGRYLLIESDQQVTIDFLRFCVVKMTIEPGDPNRLRVEIKGLDDRATILMDEVVDCPEADDRD